MKGGGFLLGSFFDFRVLCKWLGRVGRGLGSGVCRWLIKVFDYFFKVIIIL